MSKISIVARIILAIGLFFFGVYFYGKFIPMYLIKKTGVAYQSFSISGEFEHFLLFSLCIAVIPIVSIFLNLKKIKNILISAGIVSVFLVAAIFLKRFLLTLNINRFYSEELYKSPGVEYLLSLDKVLPELYMIVALIIATLLLFFLKSQKILFRYDSEESANNPSSQLLSK